MNIYLGFPNHLTVLLTPWLYILPRLELNIIPACLWVLWCIARFTQRKNVKFFKEPKEESFGKHAIIEDPDGHLISLAEIKSAPIEGFDLMGLIGAE